MLANALRGKLNLWLALVALHRNFYNILCCQKIFLKNTVLHLIGDGIDGVDGIVCSPEELAEVIEDKIFEKNKQTNPKYKAQVRSRVFNLKDKKNPSLRENVLCGVIKPEKIAVMTSEEMASDEVRV
jgi:transcription elongation factor S-II